MSNASNSPFSFAINPYTAIGERVYFGSTPAPGEARAERESTASSGGGGANGVGADDDPWEPPPPLPGIYSVIQRLIGAAEPPPSPPNPPVPPVPPVPRATLQCPECEQHFGPASLIVHIMAFHPLLFAAWSSFSSDAPSDPAVTESSFLAIAGRRTRPRWADEEGGEGADDGADGAAGTDGTDGGDGGDGNGGGGDVGFGNGYNSYSGYTPYSGYEWRRISDDTAWVQSAIGSGIAGGIGYAFGGGEYDEYDEGEDGEDEHEGSYDDAASEVEPTYEEYVALCDRIGTHEVGISNIDAVAPRVSEAADLAARCTICLESMADLTNLRKITRCRHEFCDPCLRRWFVGNHTCPICKDDSRGPTGSAGSAVPGGSGGNGGSGGSGDSDSGTPDSWDTLD